MPNWCSNSVTITGNKEQIDKFEKFLNEKNGKDWFDFFAKCPEELKSVDSPNNGPGAEKLIEKYGHSDWYSWSVDNWGTKWNCDAQDWQRNENSISFWFDSAWSPPTAIYDTINYSEMSSIEAHYLEEGMGYVGKYADGVDNYYEFSDLASLDNIPKDIVENWNLKDNLQEYEEEPITIFDEESAND